MDVEAIRAAGARAAAAVTEVRAALDDLSARLPNDYTLLTTSMGVVAMPHFPQCVAYTQRGARCRNPVFDGQMWSCPGTVVCVLEEESRWAPGDVLLALQTQRCAVHRDRIEVRSVPVEWVLIDPDSNGWMGL